MAQIEYIDGLPVFQPDGEVLWRYLDDRSHVSVIRGPIGSGTSSASCMKIWALAMEQRPNPLDGIKRTRIGIVRNSYPQLRYTTIRTWLDWFPEERFGKIIWEKPMRQVIRVNDVQLEVFFQALDTAQDVSDMRSLEVTGWWFNELEYADKVIFDEAESRTGRFPAEKDGGTNWDGVLADMNAPSEEHWLVQMTGEAPLPEEMPEEERALMKWPKEWGYFVQPAALIENRSPDGKVVLSYSMNPAAENTKWLKPGFYEEKLRGKSKKWIDSHLMNKITFLVDGDPIWPNVDQDIVFSKHELPFQNDREVVVSLDFGRARPCALVAQEIGSKIQIQREFRMYGASAAVFAPALKRFLAKEYPGAKLRFTGDPKGRDKGQATEKSAYDIFESHGMKVTPAPARNNNLDDRINAVSNALELSRILVGPQCTTTRHALAGKYRWKKVDVGDPEPFKDKYSENGDCLQYLCLFLGEGRRMLGMTPMSELKPARMTQFRTLRRIVA